MVKRSLLVALLLLGAQACGADVAREGPAADAYLDYSSRSDVLSGGARLTWTRALPDQVATV